MLHNCSPHSFPFFFQCGWKELKVFQWNNLKEREVLPQVPSCVRLPLQKPWEEKLYFKFCCWFLCSSLCFSSSMKSNSWVFLSKYHQYFIFMETQYLPPFPTDSSVQQKQPQFSSDLTGRKETREQWRWQLLGRREVSEKQICSLIKTHLIHSLSAEGIFTTQLLHVHSVNGKNNICFQQREGCGRNERSAPRLVNRLVCHHWVGNRSSYKSYFHLVLN